MSKSDQLREQQLKINTLQSKLDAANKEIEEYKRRDRAQIGDFIKRRTQEVKP